MASYEKRGNTWRYRISLGKDAETGKYKYISNSGFKRKSDAKHHAEMVKWSFSNVHERPKTLLYQGFCHF